MKINFQNKKNIVLIGVLLITILVISIFVLNLKKPKKIEENKIPLPSEAAIPTVDKTVSVNLEKEANNKEVVLKIENAPMGTQSIEYTLFYNTAEQGIQGVNGIFEENSQQTYQRKITLGTCSSGSCVYHQVVGKIKLTLRFTGDYGERLFEKEY